MRRGTLIVIIALFVVLVVASVAQLRLGRGPRRYPGPSPTVTPTAAIP